MSKIWTGTISIIIMLFEIASAATLIQIGDKHFWLALASDSGRAQGLFIEGKNVLTAPGGFYVEDAASEQGALPVRGPVRALAAGIWRQETHVEPLGLDVQATYQARPGALYFHCHLRDLTGRERALVVSYRLPVKAEGLRWGQDLVHSQLIAANAQNPDYQPIYRNSVNIGAGAEGIIDRYPFSALSGPQWGLSWAIRMDEPRVFLTQYRMDLRCYEIRFSLGLSAATKKFPRQADCSFLLYQHNPQWGFRSAAEKYYELFPEFFVVRVQRLGGWYCNTNPTGLASAPRAYDYGFAYHEAWASAQQAMQFSNKMGLYTFHYTEPFFYWQLLPEEFWINGKPSVEGGLAKLAHDLDPTKQGLLTRDGSAALLAGEVRGITYDDFVRKQSLSVQKSLLWDEQGQPRGFVTRYPWTGPSGHKGDYRVRIPLNLDPDIPEGAGHFQKEWMMDPAYEAARQKNAVLDGIYLDSYGLSEQLKNFRAEHFAFTDVPLTFDPQTKRVCLLNDFSAFEFCRWLAEETRKQGRFLLTNYYHKNLFFNVIFWDVIGSEGYKRDEQLGRLLCYRKPYSDLAYGEAPGPINTLFWREYLLYATFPGQNTAYPDTFREISGLIRRQMQAGWRPVTEARCSDKDILLERYGGWPDGNKRFWDLLLAVQNPTNEARQAEIVFEVGPWTGGEIAYDLLNQRFCPVHFSKKQTKISVPLLSHETTLIAIGTPQDVAQGIVKQAQEYWADVCRVEAYPQQEAIATQLEALSKAWRSKAIEKEIWAKLYALRKLWDAKIGPQAYVAELVERAASVWRGLQIRTAAKATELPHIEAELLTPAQLKWATLNWEMQTPKGWQAQAQPSARPHSAAWNITASNAATMPNTPQENIFFIRARGETADKNLYIVEKRLIRLSKAVKGGLKQQLLADNLEGEKPLRGWSWRDGGQDLAARMPESGLMPVAARSGKRGFRLTDNSAEAAVGVRSPLFRDFQPGDFVQASAYIRPVQGQGVALYLQCWKNPEGPDYYTMIRTQPCAPRKEWQHIVIEAPIPPGTTAISFEIFSSTAALGVFDFDDVELALHHPQEKIIWLGVP